MIDAEDEQVAAAGVAGRLVLDDVLFAAKKATRIAPLQVVRDDRVVGMDHIRSAAAHASRARDEGRAKADRPEVEFTRYLAAKRTIREAIDHIGLGPDARSGIVVALGPHRHDAIRHFIDNLGLQENDHLIVADEEHLRDFGITQDQIDATTPERRLDLALEAVAGVDVMRA